MTSSTARDKLVVAAFELFDEQGYDGTTTDQIAARAGVGRTTFFRAFAHKEEVVFPDHDRVIDEVDERLRAAPAGSSMAAAIDATGIVLKTYVGEGARAITRYQLTSEVPALRDREVASVTRYQRVLYQHFRRDTGLDALTAELLASAFVTAHNYVLRKWLRGSVKSPDRELTKVLTGVYTRITRPASDEGTAVVVLRSGETLETVLPALRAALGQ